VVFSRIGRAAIRIMYDSSLTNVLMIANQMKLPLRAMARHMKP